MRYITIPKIIIIDLHQSYNVFCKRVSEYDLNHETTPLSILQEMWQSFAYKEARDEMAWDQLYDIVERELGFDNDLDTANSFSELVQNMSCELYDAIELHGLYGEIDYLPYNLELMNDIFVLRRDDDIIRVQNEYFDEDEDGSVRVIVPDEVAKK